MTWGSVKGHAPAQGDSNGSSSALDRISLGVLLPLPRGPSAVLHTRAPCRQCLCGVTRLMPLHHWAEVRGCVLKLTGWGRAILCAGLDNYIFYVRQSQKLEQMPLW